MKELFTTCSVPPVVTNKTDPGYNCTSTWGESQPITSCTSCKLPDNIKSKCKCYSNYELKEMQECPQDVQNARLLGDQFCGYVDDSGTLVGCGPGCCDPDGCPGECCNGITKPPDAQRPIGPSTTSSDDTDDNTPLLDPNVFKFLMFILVLLLITNVLLLTIY